MTITSANRSSASWSNLSDKERRLRRLSSALDKAETASRSANARRVSQGQRSANSPNPRRAIEYEEKTSEVRQGEASVGGGTSDVDDPAMNVALEQSAVEEVEKKEERVRTAVEEKIGRAHV